MGVRSLGVRAGVPLLCGPGWPCWRGTGQGGAEGACRPHPRHQGLNLYRYIIHRMQTVMDTQIHTSS